MSGSESEIENNQEASEDASQYHGGDFGGQDSESSASSTTSPSDSEDSSGSSDSSDSDQERNEEEKNTTGSKQTASQDANSDASSTSDDVFNSQLQRYKLGIQLSDIEIESDEEHHIRNIASPKQQQNTDTTNKENVSPQKSAKEASSKGKKELLGSASSHSKNTEKGRSNFSESETQDFICIATKYNLFEKNDIRPSRNSSLWQKVQHAMIQRTHSRTQSQLFSKLKLLKQDYENLKSAEKIEEMIYKKKYLKFLYDTAILKKPHPLMTELDESLDLDTTADNQPKGTTPKNQSDQSTSSASKRLFWNHGEIDDLLSLCIENHLFEYKDDLMKNSEIYAKITNDMKKSGWNRDYDQVNKKVIALRKEYYDLQRILDKSGEQGLLKATANKPYYPKMKELFARRPRDVSDTQFMDSIDVSKVLNTSISYNENQIKPLKKPKTPLQNLLGKSMEEQKKADEAIVQKFFVHDRELLAEQVKSRRELLKESNAGLAEVLNNFAEKQQSLQASQFLQQLMIVQAFFKQSQGNVSLPGEASMSMGTGINPEQLLQRNNIGQFQPTLMSAENFTNLLQSSQGIDISQFQPSLMSTDNFNNQLQTSQRINIGQIQPNLTSAENFVNQLPSLKRQNIGQFYPTLPSAETSTNQLQSLQSRNIGQLQATMTSGETFTMKQNFEQLSSNRPHPPMSARIDNQQFSSPNGNIGPGPSTETTPLSNGSQNYDKNDARNKKPEFQSNQTPQVNGRSDKRKKNVKDSKSKHFKKD